MRIGRPASGGRVLSAIGFRSRRTTVGLDIGSGFNKAVVVDHARNAPRLARVAIAPNAEGTVVAGAIRDPDRVAESLASMFARGGIAQREVVIGVSGRDVMSKLIEVDRMDEEEARAAIPWEAEQHVPFDMEAVQLDFVITDPSGEGPTMTVLLAAAKRELIETRVSLLRRAGLIPVAVDVEALALHNALEANYPGAMQGVTGLVDVGAEATTVHVLADGVPVLARDLGIGTGGLSGDDVTPRAGRIANGIERAGAFVEAGGFGLGLARIFLCGGGVAASGLSDLLAQRLGVETHVANALERLDVGPDVADRTDLGDVAPMLMLSVGLALRRP
ncbi:type IV pilus biogenesis protein PilM [Candidatus Palauibacter sp.]|uniref:type IV pilus biogenesis protein PilM n=1 Tax=Candidatus Palauibacter sp. TaxID=3101350 RepID=UPI003AF1E447